MHPAWPTLWLQAGELAALDDFTRLFDAAQFRKGLEINFKAAGSKLQTTIDGRPVRCGWRAVARQRGSGAVAGAARRSTPPRRSPASAKHMQLPPAAPNRRCAPLNPSCLQVGTISNKALARSLLDIYLGRDPASKGAKESFGAGLASMVLASA